MPDDQRTALAVLEDELHYRFGRIELLDLALTHRSWANERDSDENYERLEFLGDAVVGVVVAEWLYQQYPEQPEGELSKLKSYLVSAPILASYAETIGLGELLRLGVGEERSGGRVKASLLADSMESVFGAVYVDGGLEGARAVILPLVRQTVISLSKVTRADAKTELQEFAQSRGWQLPEYRLAAEHGPDHQKLFTVECWLLGACVGVGTDSSKKRAEQRAASGALAEISAGLGPEPPAAAGPG